MRIKTRHTSATTLITTLVITGIIASIFGAYLTLVSNRTRLVFRAQAWERCMAVCEAGVEEAFGQLNKNGATNLVSNGWKGSSNAVSMTRTIGDSYYTVSVSTNTNSIITITALGYVPLPNSPSQHISRTVRITVTPDPTFPYAVVTEEKNEIAGVVDSFDSSNPAYSTNGMYDATKARDQAFVGSNKKAKSKILKLKSKAKVYGRIAVGAGSTAETPNQSSAGDSVWVNGGNGGVQSGHYADDMNLYFPPVAEPFTGGYFTPGPGAVNGTNYSYVLTTGDYLLSSLKLDKNDHMAVTGNSRLKVTGKIEIKDEGMLWLFSGSLKLYAADDVTISGGVANQTRYATNFTLYGLPSNKKIDLKTKSKSPTQPLIGTIYAPSANLKLDGTTLIGGSVSYSMDANKNSRISYDEALGTPTGPKYIVKSWEEL